MEELNREPADDGCLKSSVPYKKMNSISSKVTSVLAMSSTDSEFREALSLLDQRNLVNDAKTRRQIRLDLQKDMIKCNGLVIDQFGHVSKQLSHVKAVLDTLNSEYGSMKSRVEMAHEETSLILQEAVVSLQKRELLRKREGILAAFQDRFIMTEDELVILTSTAEPLDHRFFTALSKAKAITKDCEVLLGLEKQTFGLDLMEQASKNLNLGFQKLYKWLQREFKAFNPENSQMSSSIRHALRVLAERQTLFQSCIAIFSEVRERILSESFHLALTGKSSSGVVDDTIKPIDLIAHDTMRHVGDMLAWVHSAAVGEREALEVLFVAEGEELAERVRLGKDTEVWRLVAENKGPESEFDGLKALGDVVDKNLSSTARQLQQRIEQVIQANEDIVTAYKLATLLGFYRTIFDKLLGSSTSIVEYIRGLESEALRQFRSLVKDGIDSVQTESQTVPTDLAPPKFFTGALEQLRAIMKTYESSLSYHENREYGFELVLSTAFEPFLSACENMAGMMTPLEGSIFIINASVVAKECLDGFSFTQRRAEELEEKIKAESGKVVGSQYAFLRLKSGLEPALFERIGGTTTVKVDASKDVIGEAGQRLDGFLPSAIIDANDRIRHIRNGKLARDITAEAAEMFCQDFEKWERAMHEKEQDSGTDSQDSFQLLFPRTSADIRLLLL